jgi:hypothetical protein
VDEFDGTQEKMPPEELREKSVAKEKDASLA